MNVYPEEIADSEEPAKLSSKTREPNAVLPGSYTSNRRGKPVLAAALLSSLALAMGFGILCVVWSIWEMTTWTPDIDTMRLVITITVQGFGLGFLFIPLQMVAFATLPVMLRTDGASLFSLARNIGAAIGVSITSSMLARNTQTLHAEIGAHVNPFNRALQDGAAVQQHLDPATRHGAAMLDQMINHQAQIAPPVANIAPANMTARKPATKE
jgi:hypothetical protein